MTLSVFRIRSGTVSHNSPIEARFRFHTGTKLPLLTVKRRVVSDRVQKWRKIRMKSTFVSERVRFQGTSECAKQVRSLRPASGVEGVRVTHDA
ncbi:hypothetical protein [Burkholderia metallica]|uniref:hypothetical protein n=1 Tax=Burkholderia metallica TaxID=488729 RepID=UPI0015839757|nr:hypothetical protein [Burkholderia metallica]